MCDRIAIMKEGRILQVATPTKMYQHPANDFVAGFLGNPPIAFLEAKFRDGFIQILEGAISLDFPEKLEALKDGTRIRLGIRPEHYQPNHPIKIPGKISFVEIQGRENLYDVTLDDGNILRSIQPSDREKIELNSRVEWGVQPKQILLFDESGKRL